MKIFPNKTLSIGGLILIGINVLVFISVISISTFWFIHDVSDMKDTINEIKSKSKGDQKEYIREQVYEFISFIDLLRSENPGMNDDSVRELVLQFGEKRHLQHGGYIFINHYDGQALLFDGKVVKEYKDLSDMTDPTGKRLFDIERKAYNNPDGGYMEYLFKQMNTEVPEPKISYMKGYHDWEWIIGAGIYVTEPEKEIEAIIKGYKKKNFSDILQIIMITIIILAISTLIIIYINKKLNKQIGIVTDFIRNAAHSDDLINEEKIYFRDLKIIARSLNQMIEEKTRLSKEISDHEERIRTIFQASIHMALVIFKFENDALIIDEFSPGAERIFGYSQEEIKGQKASILFVRKNQEAQGRLRKLLLGGKSEFQGETRFVRKNGEVFPVLFSLFPLFSGKNMIGSLGLAVDISKRKRAEEELLNIKENLENMVYERTCELEQKNRELIEKNKELEKYHELFINREFRIKELRDKLAELKNMK